MSGSEEIEAQVRAQAEVPDLVQRLAERIGVLARASAVFGEPVVRGGVTVIPVAKATFGFGGGEGGDATQQGSGGGGGGRVSPIGYIEVREDGAKFRPVRDPRLVGLGAAAAIGAAAWALRRIVRA